MHVSDRIPTPIDGGPPIAVAAPVRHVLAGSPHPGSSRRHRTDEGAWRRYPATSRTGWPVPGCLGAAGRAAWNTLRARMPRPLVRLATQAIIESPARGCPQRIVRSARPVAVDIDPPPDPSLALEPARHYVETFDLRRRPSLYLTYTCTATPAAAAWLCSPSGSATAPWCASSPRSPGRRPERRPFASTARGLELIRTALRDGGSPLRRRARRPLRRAARIVHSRSQRHYGPRAGRAARRRDRPGAPLPPPQYLSGTELRA